MTEPTHLTRDQLAPIVAAIHRRETAALIGLGLLLPPFPDCPTCGQAPTEMAVGNSNSFIDDLVRFGFRPCNHTFAANGEDLYETYTATRQQEGL